MAGEWLELLYEPLYGCWSIEVLYGCCSVELFYGCMNR